MTRPADRRGKPSLNRRPVAINTLIAIALLAIAGAATAAKKGPAAAPARGGGFKLLDLSTATVT